MILTKLIAACKNVHIDSSISVQNAAVLNCLV